MKLAAGNNPTQYIPRENDQTGLMFYRSKYYDPALNRVISEDRAECAAGLNGYPYVNNAPTEYSDPEGKLPVIRVAIR